MSENNFILSEKIKENIFTSVVEVSDIKEFIKWCERHSHIADEVQVIAISKLKEGAGDKLTGGKEISKIMLN